MTLAAGSKLGPYEILAPIGAGGMGEVYRAKDPRLGREVAIKVLPPSFSQDAERLRRFEQEAKAAGVLNHPNITAVYDIGSHEGAPYVVQELLEGETLRAELASGGLCTAQGDRVRAADRRGPGGGAREGDRPPGPEAREPLRHPGRPRQDPRLRPGEVDRGRVGRSVDEPSDVHADRTRGRHGDARLHVARAGQGKAGRCALGHLRLRRGPLRNALGKARLPRRLGRGDDGVDPQGGPARSSPSPTRAFPPASSASFATASRRTPSEGSRTRATSPSRFNPFRTAPGASFPARSPPGSAEFPPGSCGVLRGFSPERSRQACSRAGVFPGTPPRASRFVSKSPRRRTTASWGPSRSRETAAISPSRHERRTARRRSGFVRSEIPKRRCCREPKARSFPSGRPTAVPWGFSPAELSNASRSPVARLRRWPP